MKAIIFALPFPFSANWSSAAAFKTRVLNSGETRSLPVATRETVAMLTPAALATSSILVFAACRVVLLAITSIRESLGQYREILRDGLRIYSEPGKTAITI